MADAFDKFKSSLNRGITTINVKANSFSEKTKIKTHIDTLKSEIQKLYLEIGETSYNKWINADPDCTALEQMFEQVKIKQQTIAERTAELDAIDERDNQILGTASKPAATYSVICPKCGAGYDSPVKFCRSCGSKIGE